MNLHISCYLNEVEYLNTLAFWPKSLLSSIGQSQVDQLRGVETSTYILLEATLIVSLKFTCERLHGSFKNNLKTIFLLAVVKCISKIKIFTSLAISQKLEMWWPAEGIKVSIDSISEGMPSILFSPIHLFLLTDWRIV